MPTDLFMLILLLCAIGLMLIGFEEWAIWSHHTTISEWARRLQVAHPWIPLLILLFGGILVGHLWFPQC